MIDGTNGKAQILVFALFQKVFEIGTVPSTYIRRAFQEMTDDQGACKLVELIRSPLMPPAVLA